MWQVVCDRCLYTETLQTEEIGELDCPVCGCGQMLGPVATAPRRFSRETEWDLLTSPLYRHAGETWGEPAG